MEIQSLQNSWSVHQKNILLVQIRRLEFVLRWTQENGGGHVRYGIHAPMIKLCLSQYDLKQVELEDEFGGVTIIPLLISSDKTQVVTFGTKSAYPVYVTIGNIPKELRRKPSRRTHVLLGYLPTTPLHHVSGVTSRHRMLANLFHYCMSQMLRPLE